MRKKPKPKKVNNGATAEEEIAKALKLFKGMQYLAADALKMADSTLSERIKQSPYLQAIRDSCVERRLDMAEINLSKLIEEENDLGAICFLLKTRGKHRGYQETTNQMVVPAEYIQKFDATIAQLKELQQKRD